MGNELFDLLGKVGMNFIELSSELGNLVYYYSIPEVIGIFKNGVTLYMIKNKDEYDDFLQKLEDFLREFEVQLKLKGDISLANSIKKLWAIKEKYPKYFDELVLQYLSMQRATPYVIHATLKYLQGKNITTTVFNESTNGLKQIMIVSTKEIDYSFLNKELSERGKLEMGLRKLTREEKAFLTDFEWVTKLIFLSPQDLAYCSKNEEYEPALLFNYDCYLKYLEERGQSTNLEALIFLLQNNIQFVDVSKLKTIILYRMIEKGAKNFEIEDVINSYKSIKNVTVTARPIHTEIFDADGLEFRLLESKKEDAKAIMLEDTSEVRKKEFRCDEEFQITSREILELAKEAMTRNSFRMYLNGITALNVKIIPRNIHLLRDELVNLLKQENPDLADEEIQKLYQRDSEILMSSLYDERIIDISLVKLFDENIIVNWLSNGKIKLSIDEIKRQGFSKQSIYQVSQNNPEKFLEFLNGGLISKEEILNYDSITPEMISYMFANDYLTIEEIAFCVSKNKIDLSKLSLDKEKLDQISPELFAEIYIKIAKKRIEYDKETLSRLENYDSQEDEFTLTENEFKLQKELQELSNLKNIYTYLFRMLELDEKEKINFSENMFLGALEKTDDLYGEFLIAIQEMYKDGFVSIEQIRDLDPKLLIEAIKSGVIQAYDIRENIITPSELEDIEKLVDSEEEKAKEIAELRYLKLEEIVSQIIKDTSITSEEKLGIIYNIYTLNTPEEKKYRSIFEQEILGTVEGRFTFLKENYGKEPSKKKVRDGNLSGEKPVSSNNYVYPTYMIWQFMRILDPKISIQTFSDGNVVFSSEKLNKTIIESIWTGNEEGLQRSYGVVTTCLDKDVYDANEPRLIMLGRRGYRINLGEARQLLPIVQTPRGPKRKGLVRHNKDLSHSGKKIWFELLMENLGINLSDIESGKDTRYTKEDLAQIQEFLEKARTSYERV